MASTIPGARTALVDLLDALTGPAQALQGVAVRRSGRAGERSDDLEHVWIENAGEIARTYYFGGNGKVKEEFVIPVRVEVIQHGDDIEAVETRMWDVLTAVERTVLASQHLSGLLAKCAPEGIPNGEASGPTDDGHVLAAATVRLECIGYADLSA